MSEVKHKFKIYKLLKSSDEITNRKYIERIVEEYNLNQEFKFEKVGDSEKNEYEINIYYRYKENELDWLEILKPFLKNENGEIKINKKNIHNSIVMFIYNKSSIYAFTRGQGNYLIQNYVDNQFGVDITLRIVNVENEISFLSETLVFSNIKNESVQYREKESFIGIDNFGKKINEISLKLKKDNIQFLGDNLEIIESGLDAGSYFNLKKDITFDQLISMIKNFDKILNKKPMFEPSLIQIKSKIQKEKIKLVLKENVKKYIYNGEIENENYFELMFPATEGHKFDKFSLKYLNVELELENLELDEIIKKVQMLGIDKIDDIKLVSEFGTEKFKSPLLEKFGGRVEIENKYYYILDNIIYKMKNTFFEDLNRKSDEIRKNIYMSKYTLPIDWKNNEDEDTYNKKFDNEKYINYFTYDKITHQFENVEICDIFKIDDENEELVFYHLKKGFNQNMRNLGYQLKMSSNVISSEISTREFNVINQMYDLKKDQIVGTKEEFINKFKKYKIIFCMGIKTGNTQSLQNDEMKKFKSGVAKFALLETQRYVRSKNFQLYMIEV